MIERSLHGLSERFSKRVKTIYGLAEQEARHLRTSVLTEECLFLGIIIEGHSPAKEMLEDDMGVELKVLRTDIEDTLHPKDSFDPSGVIQVSEGVITVLQNAVPSGGEIGSERLLISLAGTNTKSLAPVLEKHKINPERATQAFADWRKRRHA